MTFTLPTRTALLEHRRRQQEDGFLFPLAATSVGMDETLQARVRRLNTTDRASIEMLPSAVQDTVFSGMKAFEKEQKAAEEAGKPGSLSDVVLSNQRVLLAADAVCIAAFIEPKLVATEDELAANPGAYTVNDIAAEDRISFFMACADADSASARQLKTFRHKPAESVAAGATGGLASFPTIGPDGAA